MDGGPVGYFLESQLSDPQAQPILQVKAMRIDFGDPCPLMGTVPEFASHEFLALDGTISSSAPLRGVRLRWTDIMVDHEDRKMSPDFCHIYRRSEGQDDWTLIGWRRFADQEFIDTEFGGKRSASYALVIALDYPFGYRYEGLVGLPLEVNAIA